MKMIYIHQNLDCVLVSAFCVYLAVISARQHEPALAPRPAQRRGMPGALGNPGKRRKVVYFLEGPLIEVARVSVIS